MLRNSIFNLCIKSTRWNVATQLNSGPLEHTNINRVTKHFMRWSPTQKSIKNMISDLFPTMKTNFIFGLALFVVAGCSSYFNVSNEHPSVTYSFTQVNEKAKDKSFTIFTKYGAGITANDLFIKDDSTIFFAIIPGKKITIPTSAIMRITMEGSGVKYGLRYGAIVGAGFGILLSGEVQKNFGNSSPESYLYFGGVSLVGGAFLGFLVGSIADHGDTYIFQSQSNNFQKE